MISERSTDTARRGRRRSFDRDVAVDRAMLLFWERGYEGTSVADLISAIGIHPPSFYAAFGGKPELFLEALDRYLEMIRSGVENAIALSSSRDVVEALLCNAVEGFTSSDCPKGCLVITSRRIGSVTNDRVARQLAEWSRYLRTRLEDRFKQAQAAGDLSPEESPADLADYVLFIMDALGLEARSGVHSAQLRRFVRRVVDGWPSSAT